MKLENNWNSFIKWWSSSVVLSFIGLAFFGDMDWTVNGIVKIVGSLIFAWFFLLGLYLGLVGLVKTFISENYAGRIIIISIVIIWFIAHYSEMRIDFGW